MGKTGDAIVIILIWGGLFSFLFKAIPDLNFSNSSLASVFSSFQSSSDSDAEAIISVSQDKENFQGATFHSADSADIFSIEVSVKDPNLIFAGSDRGLLVSKNAGLDWYGFSDLEQKITSAKIYKILTSPSHKNEIFVSVFKDKNGTVYRTTDKFFSLESIFEIQDEAVYDFDIVGDSLYLGLSDGRILIYSANKKESRVLNDLGSPIVDLDIERGGQLIYAVLKSGGLLVSENAGKSFIRSKKEIDKIKTLFVDLLNYSKIYAATKSGLVCSYDSGNNWRLFETIPLEDSAIEAVTVGENGEIYAASGNKIYKSRDFGSNWQILDPKIGKRAISIIAVNNGRIIVGSKE